jgi:uncharacterized DUF497 family protein
VRFEWDAGKNEGNLKKHGVAFERAVLVFASRMVWWPDLRRDYGEPRWAGLGEVEGRVYVVIWTMRGPDLYRIISARKANDREEKTYWG